MATILGFQGYSLYTGLTVDTNCIIIYNQNQELKLVFWDVNKLFDE